MHGAWLQLWVQFQLLCRLHAALLPAHLHYVGRYVPDPRLHPGP
ncbi:unnamed protein product [Fusarium graminearum]|uniref:Chromosome 1, complete genome n=1 Tax=Gibberella zeae (strain ATCC MYA-4620 / CBS 123657 / FGSC 9075 / NRRL 31084 / PH-1) TaxID=229533 RepID=A0A098D442_GIBZE|nr:unnamed protein product [Fusarium graminearum]CZS76501.1 unnamed protein product [Fusarium graminearum]